MPGYTLDDGITLKNKVGATTYEQLERIEVEYIKTRRLQLDFGQGPTGTFDTAHLKAIHRHLFQDVYEWAGHTRDEKVRLSDGSVATEPLLRKADGAPFMVGPLITEALDDVSAKLRAANYLRRLPRQEFADRAADTLAAINAAHAFREGNGRAQRAFIRELAKRAGHDLDFTVLSRERMIQASIAANEQGDPSMMRRLFDEISTPSRVAALTHALESFERQGFRWNDIYVATTSAEFPLEVTIAGIAGDNYLARTSSGIVVGQVKDLPTPAPKRGEVCRVEPSRWPGPGRVSPGRGGKTPPREPDEREH